MKRLITQFSTGLVIVSAMMMPAMASAALTAGNTGLSTAAAGSGLQTDCSGSECLAGIVGRLINAVLGFLGIVLLAIVMYAGFTWMTAGGEMEKVKKAKSMLVNAAAGIVIVASSYAIASFVITQLGTITGSGGTSTGSAGGSTDYDCSDAAKASYCPVTPVDDPYYDACGC